ncbi:EamA family transporter RarD [Mesobacterium pallidum]|uniref:EamA family transporter RarD n=1 Tax=Mesobacterium pallidum TaxID=2872037 RepID=UPI001EE394BC|nr:EamA family transporter RarD [Mesobacterium pallidum]
MTEARHGLLAVTAAAAAWGVAPLFFKLLAHVPPFELVAHRVIWSAVIFCVVVVVQGRLSALRALLRGRAGLRTLALAAALMAVNWTLFIWAVFNGRATEASLGYFIYPLLNVVLGVVVFGERLRPVQWAAVLLVALAVGVLTLGLGAVPWVALTLAGSFAAYTLVKKRLDAGPVLSVTAETVLMMPLALAYLAWVARGDASGVTGAKDAALLLLAGVVTATPLIFMSYGVRRAPLSTAGLVFYLNPSLQFLLALLVFREPVGIWHAIAFPMIWAALALYSVSALRQDRAARRRASSVATSGML